MKRSNAGRKQGNGRCPCGSRRLAKRCCWRPLVPGERFALLTLRLPGSADDVEEGIMEVSPDRLPELEAAYHAAAVKAPGDACPICVLQRRWARENQAN